MVFGADFYPTLTTTIINVSFDFSSVVFRYVVIMTSFGFQFENMPHDIFPLAAMNATRIDLTRRKVRNFMGHGIGNKMIKVFFRYWQVETKLLTNRESLTSDYAAQVEVNRGLA